ncbi:hypothetical protein [Nannocystis sp.]|uniref:hypothetical protein n=1 Tax=Nannocystis sp. TaxID=1962667 RepID=UPI0025DACE37|nr:hypothetical protein [Nannocystis sp.]MBK7826103.1 hypothetical protein [Nannocystis sp.]
MPATRRTVSLLASLLGTVILASPAQAAPRRATAQPAPSTDPAPRKPATDRSPGKDRPAPDSARVTDDQPVPKDSPSAGPARKRSKPGSSVPKDSLTADAPQTKPDAPRTKPAADAPRTKLAADAPRKPAADAPRTKPTARPLRPRREPLLARHPAASCALDPLEAVGLGQHGRARDSLREFYWSDMARFFEGSLDLAEPVPQQVADPAFTPSDQVLRELPTGVRSQLASIAAARVVDRLGEREFTRVSKLLASLSPAQVASLLRADAPTLRAYVWTWLATTKTGGCHLGHLDLEFIEAAVGDRSVAVEHGDDLVYRSLGDYALAARARLATLDPARFDAFLVRLTTAGEIDPLARATAHGILLRRGHWDTLALGLRDASPPVRAATAAAAIEMNRDKVEATMLEHAAGDPADLVSEQIVGALLGVFDPHSHGRPQLRGPLGSTRDERLAAAVARWRGHGDASEPLPAPARPLSFVAVHVPTDMSPATATKPARDGQPVLTDSSAAPSNSRARPVPADSQPVPADSQPVLADSSPDPSDIRARPVPADSQPVPPDSRAAAPEPREPSLPGVLDDPGEPRHRSPARP